MPVLYRYSGSAWEAVGGPFGAGVVTAAQEGTDGATRSSSTYGPWSTPWTCSIAVTSGQVVDIFVNMSLLSANDESIFMAIRRGSTTIYENPHYLPNPNARVAALTHFWRDTSPGTGTVTYEIYVASNSGGALTLKNGATLDTTIQLTQGKSIMRLAARDPAATAPSATSVRLGSAQVTADQGSLGTTITDLTGLSATVTVTSGHWIKITGFVGAFYGASTDLQLYFSIRESSTQLNRAEINLSTSTHNQPGHVVHLLQPSAGSHTYKLSAQTNAGTVSMAGGATAPSFILVEDLGA